METYYFFVAIILSITLLFSKFRTMGSILIILLLTLFAGSRLFIDNDFKMYYKDFIYILGNQKILKDYEFSMVLIPNIGNIFFSNMQDISNFCFMVYAFLGVSTKVIAIKKYSNYYFLSMALYVTYLFLMQEMTTIRAGVASGIFLLLLPELAERNFKSFFLKIWTALLFHYSSVVFLLIGVVLFFKLKIKYFYYALGASFLIIVFKLNILKVLLLDRIFPQVALYLEIMQWSDEEEINIWNFRVLVSIFFTVLFAFNYNQLKQIKLFDTFFKVHLISLILFFALSTTAMVFSARTFDLLSSVQLLLFPYLIMVFPKKLRLIPYVIILGYAFIQIFYLLEVGELLKPYKSWFF